MIKSLKNIVIILAFLILFLTVFIFFTLYSRLNQKPIVVLPTENNYSFLIEDSYDLKKLDVEKGILYLHLKNKNKEEILRLIDLKNGNIINNFTLKK